MFAGVTTNAGGGYDSATSIFTCPTSAFYYVHFNLYVNLDAVDEYRCVTDVMRDGERVAQVRLRLRHTPLNSDLNFQYCKSSHIVHQLKTASQIAQPNMGLIH